MQVATEVDSGIAIFPVSHKYPVHLNKKPQCGVSGLLSLIIYNTLTLYSIRFSLSKAEVKLFCLHIYMPRTHTIHVTCRKRKSLHDVRHSR